MTNIAVLGNFSGRNAGDAAILGNLLNDVAAVYPDARFLIPTLNTGFVNRHFGHYNIQALGLMPWNGAIKIFGLSTLQAMLQADLVLVTDNILFDRKLFNPLFNYLSTIALIATACKRRGMPIVLYNASLGPITTPLGIKALQRVLDASPLLILRDRFLQAIGSTLDRLIDELDIDVMYTITQVMDTKITNESLQYVKRREHVRVVSNATY